MLDYPSRRVEVRIGLFTWCIGSHQAHGWVGGREEDSREAGEYEG